LIALSKDLSQKVVLGRSKCSEDSYSAHNQLCAFLKTVLPSGKHPGSIRESVKMPRESRAWENDLILEGVVEMGFKSEQPE
jgi:hypothetical protein